MDILKRKSSSIDIELQPTSSGNLIPEEPIYDEALYSCIPSIGHEIDFSSMNQKIKNLKNYQILKVENSPSMSEVLDSIPSLVKSFLIPFHSSLCIHYRIKGRISELNELQFYNFNKNFHGYRGSFLVVFESIADNTSWIYWRLKNTKQIFCYNFTENIANVGAFVRDFLFNALKEGRTGINTSLHFHKNLLKVPVVIEMFNDSRGYNLLFLASEAGHTELVKFLMKKLNLKDAVKGVAAIDLAYEKKHFDIVLMFLKNNSRFPNNFVITPEMVIPKSLKEFLKTIDELHEAIKNKDSMKVDQIIRENAGMNFFYNQNNTSAVSVAISSKAFKVYENLIKRNVFMDQNESFDDLLNQLTPKEREKLAKIHSKNKKLLTEPHLLVLMANTNVGFDDDKRDMRLSLVHDALQRLNKNEVCKLLLQIVAATRNFEIHFDFNRDNVQFIDPKSEAYTNGLFCLSGKIYIAAKSLLNPERAHEVFGVIAHELCHFVMFRIFGNNAKPYTKKDSIRKAEFVVVLRRCRELKNLEEIVDWVFEFYCKDQYAAELIVRWPHILGHYIDNPQKVQELEETFKELVDYFNEKVLPIMRRKLPEIEKEVNQKHEEEIAKPSIVFRIYWKWILFFLSIIGLSVLILLLHPCIFKYCGSHPYIYCSNDGFNAVCNCKGNLSYFEEDCHVCANDTNCPEKEVCWNLNCYDRCDNFNCSKHDHAQCIIDDLKTRCVCANNLKWIIDRGCFECIHDDDCRSGETCINFNCFFQTQKEKMQFHQLDLIVPSSGRTFEVIKVEAVVANADGKNNINVTLMLAANPNFEFIDMSTNGTSCDFNTLSGNKQEKPLIVSMGLNKTVSFFVRAMTIGNLDLTLYAIGKGLKDRTPVEKAILIEPNQVYQFSTVESITIKHDSYQSFEKILSSNKNDENCIARTIELETLNMINAIQITDHQIAYSKDNFVESFIVFRYYLYVKKDSNKEREIKSELDGLYQQRIKNFTTDGRNGNGTYEESINFLTAKELFILGLAMTKKAIEPNRELIIKGLKYLDKKKEDVNIGGILGFKWASDFQSLFVMLAFYGNKEIVGSQFDETIDKGMKYLEGEISKMGAYELSVAAYLFTLHGKSDLAFKIINSLPKREILGRVYYFNDIHYSRIEEISYFAILTYLHHGKLMEARSIVTTLLEIYNISNEISLWWPIIEYAEQISISDSNFKVQITDMNTNKLLNEITMDATSHSKFLKEYSGKNELKVTGSGKGILFLKNICEKRIEIKTVSRNFNLELRTPLANDSGKIEMCLNLRIEAMTILEIQLQSGFGFDENSDDNRIKNYFSSSLIQKLETHKGNTLLIFNIKIDDQAINSDKHCIDVFVKRSSVLNLLKISYIKAYELNNHENADIKPFNMHLSSCLFVP